MGSEKSTARKSESESSTHRRGQSTHLFAHAPEIPLRRLQRGVGNGALSDFLYSKFTAFSASTTRTSKSVSQRSVAGCGAEQVATIVKGALRSGGESLDESTRHEMENQFGYDFRRVRVYRASQAALSTAALRARAYTVGSDIVFSDGSYRPHTESGRRLLAHELTHVVQQEGSHKVPFSGLRVIAPSDPMELQAKHVGTTLGPLTNPVHSAGPVVAREEGDKGNVTEGGLSQNAQNVIALLDKKDEIGGTGDFIGAFAILKGLSIDELLTTLIELDSKYQLDVLLGNVSAAPQDDRPRLMAAMYAAKLVSKSASDPADIARAATEMARLPEAQQNEILGRVLQRLGGSTSMEGLLEGAKALAESESALQGEPPVEVDSDEQAPTTFPRDVAAAAAAVLPGPWNPPGKQPIPFYIGTQAHIGIAALYAEAHLGQLAFYNFTPISVILRAALKMTPSVKPDVKGADAALPDIANLTKRHLYEIKPEGSEALARAEAMAYAAIFDLGGFPMSLGPTTEPGTRGTIPAPAGIYIFSSPQPGVITYRYRRPRRVRVRVRVPEREKAPDSDFIRKMQELTGLTGAALIIYIIISEGSRVAFPPRNFVPVP